MSRTHAVVLGVAIAIALAVAGLVRVGGSEVFGSGSQKREVARIVGARAAPWLEDAEITAWQPDPNWKPQAYFVVRPMSGAEFQSWADAAGLVVTPRPSAPSGVFVLPPEVRPPRWLERPEAGAADLDAQGTTERAAIWSRSLQGVAYTVIRPTYDDP